MSSLISKKSSKGEMHSAFWATMWKYIIDTNLVCDIEQLCDKAISAFQINSNTREWFRTTVGVRQGCLPLPTRLSIFLERIMTDAPEECDGKVSTGGRNRLKENSNANEIHFIARPKGSRYSDEPGVRP